jgi:CRP-like cAMP-binding protein
MSGRDSFQPYPQTRFASRGGNHGVTVRHSPRQNRLLAALPAEDYERLRPALEPIPMPLGWTIHRAGDPEKYLYFPTAGIVSQCYVTANGTSTEFAVTGSEGVVGVASILGGESMLSEALVRSAGYAYRLGAELLKSEFKHHDQLLHLLLRYTQALLVQTGQIAACNRHHSVEQQLCRCILTILDRMPSNELMLTQELIADSLGVRRESVTEAAGKLQKAGLIHYSRGHIAVPDRTLLEARACECYAVVKREYDRLLPRENATGETGIQPVAFDDSCSIQRNQNRRPSVSAAVHGLVNVQTLAAGTLERLAVGDA